MFNISYRLYFAERWLSLYFDVHHVSKTVIIRKKIRMRQWFSWGSNPQSFMWQIKF